MHLFRSEEDARNRSHFSPSSIDGIMPLANWAEVLNAEGRKHVLDGDYLSRWWALRCPEREEIQRWLSKSGPFGADIPGVMWPTQVANQNRPDKEEMKWLLEL